MRKAVLYIHGKGGSAGEAAHYRPLFPDWDVIGLDYSAQTPWEAKEEFPGLFRGLCQEYDNVRVIANSIGAFFTMNALADQRIQRAFFISPVVDMEKLILDMMSWANVTEEELRARRENRNRLRRNIVLGVSLLCAGAPSPLDGAHPHSVRR